MGSPATSNYQNLSSKMEPELIFFNSRDQLLRLDTQKIVYFEADGNLTYIVLANKLKATVSMNLSKMEEFLALQYKDKARLFMRIGKRFIINMNYIYSIQVARQKLILSDYNKTAQAGHLPAPFSPYSI
jgi:DNA-binding LytR/AlgR family response regulator